MASELESANTQGTAAGGCGDQWCDPLDPTTFCPECGNDLPTTHRKRKYCSSACEKKFNGRRFPNKALANPKVTRAAPTHPSRMDTNITGAVSELLVAADLLKKGCHVFRAQHPDAKVDLIIDLSEP